MPIELSQFLVCEEGVAHPDWCAMDELVQSTIPEAERRNEWIRLGGQWMEVLADAWGSSMQIGESSHFQLVAAGDKNRILQILQLLEECRANLLNSLPGVAELSPLGKNIVVIPDSQERYYSYISKFFPDGRFGGTEGVQIRDGYPHIAAWHGRHASVAPILAHELTHLSLMHLQLPQWIEEGLTQVFETVATNRLPLELTAKIRETHHRNWRRARLDVFWRGEGFHRHGKLQMLSYQLAEVLMRLLLTEFRPRWFGFSKSRQNLFLQFVLHAKADDNGSVAAKEYLGMTLGQLAGNFLGPGNWEPSGSTK